MTTPSKPNKKLTIISLLSLLLLTAVIYLVYSLQQPKSNGNYAKDVVKPLEEALVKAGATKVCDGGNNGRGPDNKTPYYGATFTVKANRDQAIALMTQIAKEHGFELQHASASNRGPLSSVADIYIERWYFDITSKTNPYSDLQDGNVELTSSVAASGEKSSCNQDEVVAEGVSMVGFGVRLPSFR